MSTRALAWAFDQKPKTPHQKLVLLALADNAYDNGECYPGVQRLQARTSLSESSIRRAIRDLSKQGLVNIVFRYDDSGRQTSNHYTLPLAESPPPPSQNSDPGLSNRQGGGCPIDRGVGVSLTPLELNLKRNCKEETKSTPLPPKGERETGFAQFWDAYPKKRGKAAALKAWRKWKPPLDAVLEALKWQTVSADWAKDAGQFIPHPATYLNHGRWEDAPESTGPIQQNLSAKDKLRAHFGDDYVS